MLLRLVVFVHRLCRDSEHLKVEESCVTRSIWTRADEPPPGRTRWLSQPSASPDRSLAATGPGRESRWGLSLLGVTEPKCFASSLRQQPGSSPGLLGKGFLACVRQPPRCPLRTGHGSPTVSGCGDPGGHEAPAQSCRSSVQTTHRLPVCPREGVSCLALTRSLSKYVPISYEAAAARPPRAGRPRSTPRAPRPFSPFLSTVGLSPSSCLSFSVVRRRLRTDTALFT